MCIQIYIYVYMLKSSGEVASSWVQGLGFLGLASCAHIHLCVHAEESRTGCRSMFNFFLDFFWVLDIHIRMCLMKSSSQDAYLFLNSPFPLPPPSINGTNKRFIEKKVPSHPHFFLSHPRLLFSMIEELAARLPIYVCT